jgi:transcriptional regulator with XRE-family HTH domain
MGRFMTSFFHALLGRVPKSREIQAQLKMFGANVRRERTARNLTQSRLAELAELAPRTIQKIERGDIEVLLSTLLRLQRSLGCPWQDLLNAPEIARRKGSGAS